MLKEEVRRQLIAKTGREPSESLVTGWHRILNGITPAEFGPGNPIRAVDATSLAAVALATLASIIAILGILILTAPGVR